MQLKLIEQRLVLWLGTRYASMYDWPEASGITPTSSWNSRYIDNHRGRLNRPRSTSGNQIAHVQLIGLSRVY